MIDLGAITSDTQKVQSYNYNLKLVIVDTTAAPVLYIVGQ